MSRHREFPLTRTTARDPFALVRQMTSEFDRMFDDFAWPSFGWTTLRAQPQLEKASWLPQIDVFEKDNRLVTRVDLPGLKKEDVKVEITDGRLAISGERKTEGEEKRQNFYRSERQYGSFYRAVPLPEGVKPEDINATFANGVLEVSIPLPVKTEPKPKMVEIKDAPTAAKPAA
jgi:HSP20 family protein